MNEPRHLIRFSSFCGPLPAFLKDHFMQVMDKAAKGKHPEAAGLIDGALSLLSRTGLDREAIVGFFTATADTLLTMANEICEAVDKNGKLPNHRLMVADGRYVTPAPLSVAFYDALTNKVTDSIGPNHMPVESVSYSLGAIYVFILQQRSRTAKTSV